MSALPDRWTEEEDPAAQDRAPASPPGQDRADHPPEPGPGAADAPADQADHGGQAPPDAPAASPEPATAEGQPRAPSEHPEWEAGIRLAEALVFASDRPVGLQRLAGLLPEDLPAAAVLQELAARCQGRGVQLVEVAGGWAFRTAPDLAPRLTKVVELPRRLPRAAMEALSIVAYHQPCTRAEIEDIRGASLAQSSLEALLELGLIAPRGKKEVPGRPTLWGTTPKFLDQFGLKSLSDLPKREELVTAETAPTLPLPPVGAGRAGGAPADAVQDRVPETPGGAGPAHPTEADPPAGAALQAADLPGEVESAEPDPPSGNPPGDAAVHPGAATAEADAMPGDTAGQPAGTAPQLADIPGKAEPSDGDAPAEDNAQANAHQARPDVTDQDDKPA